MQTHARCQPASTNFTVSVHRILLQWTEAEATCVCAREGAVRFCVTRLWMASQVDGSLEWPTAVPMELTGR